jgi:hypothetical protein
VLVVKIVHCVLKGPADEIDAGVRRGSVFSGRRERCVMYRCSGHDGVRGDIVCRLVRRLKKRVQSSEAYAIVALVLAGIAGEGRVCSIGGELYVA